MTRADNHKLNIRFHDLSRNVRIVYCTFFKTCAQNYSIGKNDEQFSTKSIRNIARIAETDVSLIPVPKDRPRILITKRVAQNARTRE